MKNRYLLYLLPLFCFIPSSLYSQVDDIIFHQISPPGGYTYQAISTIVQDNLGYIWMGSPDGILKYNSKEVKHFYSMPEESNGLQSNNITGISVDKLKNLWVSTYAGLCLFNRKQQHFERVNYSYENGEAPNSLIRSITADGNGNLWIADNKYVGYLNKEKNQLTRITNGLAHSPRLLYTDETNRIWIGTDDGTVYLVLPDENKVVRKIAGPGSVVRTIFATNNEIWVGYENHGARLYDLSGTMKIHYTYPSVPKYEIKNASIRKIWRDTRGRLWIGSYKGLFLSIGSELIRFDREVFPGLPNSSIQSLYEDNQGGIWIGTWAGGVAYFHHAGNKFINYRHSKSRTSLTNNMVNSFAQTPDGDLFVGTERTGLNKFILKTNSFENIQVLKEDELLNIRVLNVDKRGGLWIGSAFKGLLYKPPGKTEFIHFPEGKQDGKHVSSSQIYSLCESDSGMWIGLNLSGLNFYNFNTRQISFVSETLPAFKLIDRYTRTLYIDSKKNLWIGTLNGMYRYNFSSEKLTTFSPNFTTKHMTRSNSFYFVTELSDEKIWIGTRNDGINIYNPITDQISNFDANGLLKGKDVYGIIEAKDDNIWISSNTGLILYNREENKSRRFIITDGIQGNIFNPQAVFKDFDNNIYFGGTNGFTKIKSGRMKINNRPPNILVNNIEINKKKFTPSQIGMNVFETITLNPNERSIKIDFSADNYLLPEKNKFKYRLKNYSNIWSSEDSNGSAAFINIPAGKYVFEVMACNNDGIWNETPARLPVVIKQFWYRSTIALFVYGIAFLTVLILFFRFFLERANLKKTIQIEKIERMHEDQLHEMKLRFFTNISHEFRTPLTLITWPLKSLLAANNLTNEQHDQLETVKRNTNRLLQLINQIMDLRKLEKGHTKLNISKIELVEFMNERILHFTQEAKSKNIQFSYKYEKDYYTIEADSEKLDKIIYNLLSNAFKFTPINGKITVIVGATNSQDSFNFTNQLSFGKLENEEYIDIQVVDNGGGIDSSDLSNIFERFERGKQKGVIENSTGIGLNLCKDYTLLHRGVIIVQSTPGEGTSFITRLPAKQNAQKILYESHEKVKNISSLESPIKTNLKEEVYNDKVKILVVEDNEELRKFIIKFLQDYYFVLFAENGEQGLDILEKRNVQLVISDVMMPTMDGFEFCQKIKSQIETCHIPVILLTALSSAENTAAGLEKGADAYISKPFDETVLLSQIKNLLQQRKRLQESFSQKFIAKQPIEVGNLDNYFLNHVNTIIEENIENEHFTIDSLSAEMKLSRSQLHRKLKQLSNQTTSEYITMVKMKVATTLLSSKKYSIDEVAFRAGFNSHSYFTRCFKKIHNQSPKEFLRKL